MTDNARLPRGALAEATRAVAAVAEYIGVTCDITEPTQAGPIARAALEAALPVIERAALRDAAKKILALQDEDHARRQAAGIRSAGPPWNDMRSVLRKVARGEPIPELIGNAEAELREEDLQVVVRDNAMHHPYFECYALIRHVPTGIEATSGTCTSAIQAKADALTELRRLVAAAEANRES